LEPATAYSYLVNDHWSAEAKGSYAFVNLADETLNVSWPIPLEQAELSTADLSHPRLGDVRPSARKKTLILGANGQVGRALRRAMPDAVGAGRDEIDLTNPAALNAVNWRDVDTVINAAAYTAVDEAETAKGRRLAWELNVAAVARLVDVAREHRLTLVHISSDYVFDGTEEIHDEDEPLSPLGVYGQTKAAGDALVATLTQHYIVRTSWVVGDGKNFVKTMASLADRGISPSVVNDQYGRLTFAEDLAYCITRLIDLSAEFGTYNFSCDGQVESWATIASLVFDQYPHSNASVNPVGSAEYSQGKSLSPRPKSSVLDLQKTKRAGIEPPELRVRLRQYLQSVTM
jgi:dTDP-4-dehydrorhamnose 3,5-epimerase